MRGVIISTGQCPAKERVHPEAIAARSPRAWANVPGVTYPSESPATAPLSADNWISTTEAAELLGITRAAARNAMHKAGIPCRRVPLQGLFWQRGALEELQSKRSVERIGEESVAVERVEAYPAGWLTTAEACRRLGVARSSIQRYAASRQIRARRVQLIGSRMRPMLLCAEDVEAMGHLLAARRHAESLRQEWLHRFSQTAK